MAMVVAKDIIRWANNAMVCRLVAKAIITKAVVMDGAKEATISKEVAMETWVDSGVAIKATPKLPATTMDIAVVVANK